MIRKSSTALQLLALCACLVFANATRGGGQGPHSSSSYSCSGAGCDGHVNKHDDTHCDNHCPRSCTPFPIVGESFDVENPMLPSFLPACKIDGSLVTPTVQFKADGKMIQRGALSAATNTDVCDTPSTYGYTTDAVITYKIYCDTVLVFYPNRVALAFRLLKDGKTTLAIDLQAPFGVSILTRKAQA